MTELRCHWCHRLGDTGAKQTLLRKGVVELPTSTFIGHFALERGVGGEYETVPLYRIYLRSELVSGYVDVAEVQTLPFNETDLVMGNDVAGKRVVPDVSEKPLDSPELRHLEEEYPEVFSACVVARAQTKRTAQKHEVHEPAELESQQDSSFDLGDTVFAQLEDFPESYSRAREADGSEGEWGPKDKMRAAVNTPEATQDQVGEAEASVMTTAPVGLKSFGTLERISRHFY